MGAKMCERNSTKYIGSEIIIVIATNYICLYLRRELGIDNIPISFPSYSSANFSIGSPVGNGSLLSTLYFINSLISIFKMTFLAGHPVLYGAKKDSEKTKRLFCVYFMF
jgi:hypothetical protein